MTMDAWRRGAWRRALAVGTSPSLGPVGMRRLVDATAGALAFALFTRLGDAEILLLAMWIVLGIGAFLYGLRAALVRIVVAALLVVAYAEVAEAVGHPLDWTPLDRQELTEWPLVMLVGVIVAMLADRIATSGRHYAALYRQTSERLLTAHEDERARLARDLHDGVGQTLTAVVLTLDAAAAELFSETDTPSLAAQRTIRRAQALAVAALDEARDVAAQLRPTRIHEIGLGAAIRNLASAAGIAVDVRFDPALLPPGVLEPEREIDAYRIVQEAIGNAARHSRATTVWIDGQVADREIRLQVGDDGVGFEPSAWTKGLGLAGMQERAAILQGELTVRSLPGDGTLVELAIPVRSGAGPAGRQPAGLPVTDPAG